MNDLHRHPPSSYNSEDLLYGCDICGLKSESIVLLEEHMKAYHVDFSSFYINSTQQEDLSFLQPSSIIASFPSNLSRQLVSTCDHCTEVFEATEEFSEHHYPAHGLFYSNQI